MFWPLLHFNPVAVLAGLPVFTIVLCMLLRTPWKLVIWLYLFVPFVACLPLALSTLKPEEVLVGVAILYTNAIVLFGYVAPLFGAVARFVVLKTSLNNRVDARTLYVAAAVVGAVSGFSCLAVSGGSLGDWFHAAIGWWFVGAAAGATTGLLVVVYSQPRINRRTQHE